MSQNTVDTVQSLWTEMVVDALPLACHTPSKVEELYYRAAVAREHNQRLNISDQMGGWVDITNIYEQFKVMRVLKDIS
jgi:hypothetical protein